MGAGSWGLEGRKELHHLGYTSIFFFVFSAGEVAKGQNVSFLRPNKWFMLQLWVAEWTLLYHNLKGVILFLFLMIQPWGLLNLCMIFRRSLGLITKAIRGIFDFLFFLLNCRLAFHPFILLLNWRQTFFYSSEKIRACYFITLVCVPTNYTHIDISVQSYVRFSSLDSSVSYQKEEEVVFNEYIDM